MTRWLAVLAVRVRWGTRGAIRMELRTLRELNSAVHHDDALQVGHLREISWLDQRHLVPAIDRWGALDRFRSLHPPSLSVVLRALTLLVHTPSPEIPRTVDVPFVPARRFTDQEFEDILAHADQVNKRVRDLLNQ